MTWREQASIKRAADCIRKDLRFAPQIAFRVALQQRKHFAEVIGWEVGVAYENRPLPTGAHSKGCNCRTYGRERVFSLGRPVIRDHDGSIVGTKTDLLCRFFEERYREGAA